MSGGQRVRRCVRLVLVTIMCEVCRSPAPHKRWLALPSPSSWPSVPLTPAQNLSISFHTTRGLNSQAPDATSLASINTTFLPSATPGRVRWYARDTPAVSPTSLLHQGLPVAPAPTITMSASEGNGASRPWFHRADGPRFWQSASNVIRRAVIRSQAPSRSSTVLAQR